MRNPPQLALRPTPPRSSLSKATQSCRQSRLLRSAQHRRAAAAEEAVLPSASAKMPRRAVRSGAQQARRRTMWLPRAACAAQEAPRRARGRPCAPMCGISHAVCAAQRVGALACSSRTVARLLCPHTPQRRHSAAHVTATHAANASARLRGARRTAASAAVAAARNCAARSSNALARCPAATCARAETEQRARRRDVGPEERRPHLLRQARGCAAVRASAPRRHSR